MRGNVFLYLNKCMIQDAIKVKNKYIEKILFKKYTHHTNMGHYVKKET